MIAESQPNPHEPEGRSASRDPLDHPGHRAPAVAGLATDPGPAETTISLTRWAPSPVIIAVNVALHIALLCGVAIAGWSGNLTGTFTLGLILTAYTLGMRHAFDPDHIAAIDNTTRAMQTAARTPQTIGMFFALGHSTVVVLAAGAVAYGAGAANLTEDSPITTALGIWGAAFSGVALLVLAVVNLLTLRSLLSKLRSLDEAGPGAEGVDQGLGGGPLARIFGPALRRVTRPWHMYPVGFLFGLGFDTATEISLLILAAGGVALGAPWWVTMLLPLAFTAGMTLLDSADGVFMAHAYRWALERPRMRLRYNVTMTAVSVLFAVIIGATGLMSLASELGVHWFDWVEDVNLDYSGYLILGVFASLFLGAVLLWRRAPHAA